MTNLKPNASGWATVVAAGIIAVLDEVGVTIGTQNAALIIAMAALLLQYLVRYARWRKWLPPVVVLLASMGAPQVSHAEEGALARITLASKATFKDHQQFDERESQSRRI